MNQKLFALTVPMLSLLFACAGKTLDVGTANPAAETAGDPERPVEDAGAPSTAPGIASVAGLWVMFRQDGTLGVPDTSEPTPAFDLEIRASGEIARSTCTRSADDPRTAACTANATFDCMSGTIKVEGADFHIDIPGLTDQFTASGVGETRLLDDGTLLVRYINPINEAGYFRRVGAAGQQGGCPR